MNPVIIGNATLILGDCVEVMAGMPENSLDAIVTDPPYLISFMSKSFDSQHKLLSGENEGQQMQVWHSLWVKEAFRVLKPGGYLIAAGGARTYHRLASAIEDIGFDLRDCIMWTFSSGFPKSLNVSKAIDKSAGLEREVIGVGHHGKGSCSQKSSLENGHRPYKKGLPSDNNLGIHNITAPASPESAQWEGFGTALKPAYEPFVMARKPLSESTVAANVLKHGTGAINIDACRVGCRTENESGWSKTGSKSSENRSMPGKNYDREQNDEIGVGRWPPHLLLDGSDEVNAMFPETSSGAILPHHKTHESENRAMSGKNYARGPQYSPASSGSASRFFPHLGYSDNDIPPLKYCAKTSKRDRDEGCELFEEKEGVKQFNEGMEGKIRSNGTMIKEAIKHSNIHPTCKPTNLMRWLLNLVLPPNGTVLDPFMGSGSTLKAACLENMKCMGIEMNEEYFEIAKARVEHAQTQSSLF